MSKYIAICDGGDGDIGYDIFDSQDDAEEYMREQIEMQPGMEAIFAIDFDKQTITRTWFCQ